MTAADLALPADPDMIDRHADPAGFVVQACQRAKAWLREALEHSDIEQIAEIKSQAEALRAYTLQKQLGKDAQLAAAEIVPRAERGIGLAIRRGQQGGQIAKRGDRGSRGAPGVHGGNPGNRRGDHLGSPAGFFRHGDERADAYTMADGVTDADFEDAIGEAKAEGNLSRANVVRKIRQRRDSPPASGPQVPDPADRSPQAAARRRELISEFAASGMSSRQIGERLGVGDDQVRRVARQHGIGIRADAVLGRMRVSPLAQRDLNQARVARLAAAFDPEKMGTPTVSHRGDWYYLIDGQHRIEALKLWLGSWEDQEVQCWAYEGLTEAAEAEKFLSLNDTLPVRAFAKFQVSVHAGRDTEGDVDRIVRALGLRIARGGWISAVATLRRVYTRGGPAVLSRALGIIRDAYGEAGLDGPVIDGIGLLCQRYDGDLSEQGAIERLSSAHGGVSGLISRAGQLRQSTGSATAQCVAAAAVEVLNRGFGGRKLPSWWRNDGK